MTLLRSWKSRPPVWVTSPFGSATAVHARYRCDKRLTHCGTISIFFLFIVSFSSACGWRDCEWSGMTVYKYETPVFRCNVFDYSSGYGLFRWNNRISTTCHCDFSHPLRTQELVQPWLNGPFRPWISLYNVPYRKSVSNVASAGMGHDQKGGELCWKGHCTMKINCKMTLLTKLSPMVSRW